MLGLMNKILNLQEYGVSVLSFSIAPLDKSAPALACGSGRC